MSTQDPGAQSPHPEVEKGPALDPLYLSLRKKRKKKERGMAAGALAITWSVIGTGVNGRGMVTRAAVAVKATNRMIPINRAK